jgi:hypothetical protein
MLAEIGHALCIARTHPVSAPNTSSIKYLLHATHLEVAFQLGTNQYSNNICIIVAGGRLHSIAKTINKQQKLTKMPTHQSLKAVQH